MRIEPMVIVLMIVVGLIAFSFWKAHKNPNIEFNFFDLLMENGRLSKVSCIVLGAFTMHTWIMVRLTLDEKITEGYLTTYAGVWAAPLIAKMFAPVKEEKKDV
jgi:hypothetical protein